MQGVLGDRALLVPELCGREVAALALERDLRRIQCARIALHAVIERAEAQLEVLHGGVVGVLRSFCPRRAVVGDGYGFQDGREGVRNRDIVRFRRRSVAVVLDGEGIGQRAVLRYRGRADCLADGQVGGAVLVTVDSVSSGAKELTRVS